MKTFSEWQQYSKKNVQDLLDAMERARRFYKQAEIAELIGKESSFFSKMKSDFEKKWHTLSQTDYQKILKFLSDKTEEDFLQCRVEELFSKSAEFMGLARFFGLTEEDVRETISNFCGVYVSYRYSFRLRERSMILRGLTEIYESHDHTAVSTREVYRIQEDPNVSTNEIFFKRDGYLIANKTASLAKLFCQKTDVSKDFEIIYFLESLPRANEPHPNQIISIKGFLVDWQRLSPYVSPIILSRQEDQKVSVIKGQYDDNFLMALDESNPDYQSLSSNLNRNFVVYKHPLVTL